MSISEKGQGEEIKQGRGHKFLLLVSCFELFDAVVKESLTEKGTFD